MCPWFHPDREQRVSSCPVEERPLLVYFAQSLRTGLIKIGFSGQIEVRMRQLELDHNTINLLATTDGGRAREKEIHGLFDGVQVKDEWFAPSPLLLEYISANCTRHNVYLPVDESLDVRRGDQKRIATVIALDEEEWEQFRRLSHECGQSVSGRIHFLIYRDLKALRLGCAPEPFPTS
jgi:hypothetical protein